MKKFIFFPLVFFSAYLFSMEADRSQHSLSSEELYEFAVDIADHFEDGFQWEDVISIIFESHEFLNEHYLETPEEEREAIKTVLNHLIDLTDTPYLPDSFTDPLFKSLVYPFVDQIIPLSSESFSMEHLGKLNDEALAFHAKQLMEKYEEEFQWYDLAFVVKYSLNVAESYSKESVEKKCDFAKELICCVIDETDTADLPDFFVDWIFKKIASAMVHFYFEGMGTSPMLDNDTSFAFEQYLDEIQKHLR